MSVTTTHIFIVDVVTLKYHLEYQFAGTGAKETYVDFNANPNTGLNATVENNLVSMIADSQRVRKGDYVVFYLQQNIQSGIYEGKFFGIFRIKEGNSFLDNNDSSQFLNKELIKSLTFRTLIEPDQVYPVGVTEWEALDEIKHIQSPHQMLWSLIYRKLKGNRGNTMITRYESDRLFKLIRNKNGGKTLNSQGFTFDIATQEIEPTDETLKYVGRKDAIDVLPRLIKKFNDSKAFETHLQAYIVQNIGRNTNSSLDKCLLDNSTLDWIGNEVSCGVGMQRIDVMLSLNKKDVKTVLPIELKAKTATEDNVRQLQRYVNWLEQYYIPNNISDICPVLISQIIQSKHTLSYRSLVEEFRQFNKNNSTCLPLVYIEYGIHNNFLEFAKVTY